MIGAGQIACEGHIPGYRANEDLVDVVAVVDPDSARRRLAAERLPVAPSVSVATLAEALDSVAVDAVVIASPPASHAAVILDALSRGVAVVCEKPLCRSGEELDVIRAAAAAGGGHVAVLHNYLYKPGWRTLFDLVESGRIGVPVMARFEELSDNYWQAPQTPWREDPANGGGPLRDQLYHAIYLAERVLGSRIVTVQATQASLVHRYPAGDAATLALRHENGSLTQATTSWCYTGRRRGVMEAVGTDACIRYEYWERPGELILEQGSAVEPIVVEGADSLTEWGYPAAFRDTFGRLLAGRQPACGIDDAARVVAVMEQAGTAVLPMRSRRFSGRARQVTRQVLDRLGR
ncbi:MAG: Gfo/Idh/MocA family protein [Acidimicrobiales bacterium]